MCDSVAKNVFIEEKKLGASRTLGIERETAAETRFQRIYPKSDRLPRKRRYLHEESMA